MRIPISIVIAAVAAAGCSDDTPTSSSGSTTTGPAGTERIGALNMEVYATENQTCLAGNIHLDVGNVKAEPPETVVDGFDGVDISCSVTAAGEAFVASGSITRAPLEFSFGDVMTDGGSAAGSVSFKDPATGTPYATTAGGQPCVFEFLESASQTIGEGHIRVGFNCAQLVSEASPADVCSARYGYLLLDRCAP